tara:strand:- start:67 stop:570 length:504 start_codon:yes stop_codon:yes gene_type:complete
MYNTNSPNKKKLKSGVRSTVGGKLGGTSYKTASPYNIKTNNMINTNGLSPLMQAAVGGAVQTIPGQNITKTEEGFSFSPGEGMEPIPVQDPDGLLEMTEDGFVMDNDYQVEEGEGGLVVKGVAGGGGEEGAPGTPAGPGAGAMGGVGGPMEMHSPVKNYKKGYYGIK